MTNNLNVRLFNHNDLDLLMKYWFSSSDEHLIGMGVDLARMPTEPQFRQAIAHQLTLPIEQKNAFPVIWELDGKPIGHSNTNPTTYGETAKMHLHLWENPNRQKGLGTAFMKMTLPFYFNYLKLKTLICEPYALNPAPNKTMQRVGFEFVKEHFTIPGNMSFEQPVNRWKMTREQFDKLF